MKHSLHNLVNTACTIKLATIAIPGKNQTLFVAHFDCTIVFKVPSSELSLRTALIHVAQTRQVFMHLHSTYEPTLNGGLTLYIAL